MEFRKSSQTGKSRLSDEQLARLRDPEPVVVSDQPVTQLKGTSFKIGTVLFGLFVFLVIGSVFFRLYVAPAQQLGNEDSGTTLSPSPIGEEISLDQYAMVEIQEGSGEYSEPERAFHIERRQQFCAKDLDEARRLYSEYIGEKNRQVMEIKPRTVSDEQWIKEKKQQGAYKENLGETETAYYYEYPTTGGTYVDLMRIHKCEVLNPAGRIIPITSVDEDGYIPEYEIGIMGIETMTEEDMISYLEYLISMRHDATEIQNVTKKSLGDFLTLTLEMEYVGTAKWVQLKKDEEAYREAVYTINLKTGLLTYSEELFSRDIEPSPTPQE